MEKILQSIDVLKVFFVLFWDIIFKILQGSDPTLQPENIFYGSFSAWKKQQKIFDFQKDSFEVKVAIKQSLVIKLMSQ